MLGVKRKGLAIECLPPHFVNFQLSSQKKGWKVL